MDHTQSIAQVFDQKYKAVLFIPSYNYNYLVIDWLNDNTANRDVKLSFEPDGVFIAFEDENDALIFKIKFL